MNRTGRILAALPLGRAILRALEKEPDRRYQRAGTLSGGEQQMLAIGRAMMSLPRLMLIDEASLGLSPRLAKTVFSIVDRINNGNTPAPLTRRRAEKRHGTANIVDRDLIA